MKKWVVVEGSDGQDCGDKSVDSPGYEGDEPNTKELEHLGTTEIRGDLRE